MYAPAAPLTIPSQKRFIECVTVSVGYGDILAQTLPHNRHHFDRMVVVSDTKDAYTHSVCEYYNVHCIKSDIFYEDGDVFNKAKGINLGLQYLEKKDWVLHLDSDIYLPVLTRTILERIPLDPQCIYGVDRAMCNSFEEWVTFLSNPKLQHHGWIFVEQPPFPLGARLSQYYGEGYQPIGFHQLWNPKGSNVYTYPVAGDGADRTDVVFLKQFKPEHRRFIPDYYTIHLESELVPNGTNWRGRKSKPFCLDE